MKNETIPDCPPFDGSEQDDQVHKALAAASVLERIEAALARQALREAGRIGIDVDGSVVTLKGRVRTWAESDAAEGAARSAPGVSRIKNELVVEA